ncbi:MAG: formylmethanofuran dehydrogenase subunit E family protein [Candidatus Gastranaerophilales bacterium]|nr:formylmethanofuran dehydrogenase subunit E family protein [Candidatus Gastranaerophilales bacterium]
MNNIKFKLFALLIALSLFTNICYAQQGKTNNTPDWFYPKWAAKTKYNCPVTVLDTDSGLGRYSLQTKQLGLKDLARIHGHLCDGMVIAYIEIKAALEKLFPDGVIDRTDIRIVSKNGPCWVDTASMMTGARINFKTLSIDKSIGDGFIVQRISTGEAYDVHLKTGIFPEKQTALEAKIRKLRAEDKPVSTNDINEVEKMANELSQCLLNTSPSEILNILPLKNYNFVPTFSPGKRGDIINKNMPR